MECLYLKKTHRSEKHGIAERTVRRVKKGTSAVLLQSGLDEKWWADSVECYCFLRNVHDLLGDDSEDHLRDRSFRSEQCLNIIPFCSRDKSRLHQIRNASITKNSFG